MDVLCHGSANKESFIADLGDSPKVTRATLKCSLTGRWTWDHSATLDVLALSCSASMEPVIKHELGSNCSPVGAAGRPADAKISRVQIGWDIDGQFVEQIDACVDEKVFETELTEFFKTVCR